MLRTIVGLGCASLLGWSATVYCVEVNIQGTTLIPVADGSTCIDISGEYPGVRIEASEAGKTPLVCYSDSKDEVLALRNVTFVSTLGASQPIPSELKQPDEENEVAVAPLPAGFEPGKIVIEFQHTFPPGPNGKVMARAKIHGVFTTPTGTEVATGDKIRYTGFFSQGGKDDLISEALDHEVSDEIDTALFEYNGKKRYLISGPRTLKAKLEFSFSAPGHMLTLLKGASVSIDTGSRFEDKLEEMETETGEMIPEEPAEEVPDLEEEFSF